MQVLVTRNNKQVTFELPCYDMEEKLKTIDIYIDDFEDFYADEEYERELTEGIDFSVEPDFTDYDLQEACLPKTLNELEEVAEFIEDSDDKELDVFLTLVRYGYKNCDDAMYTVRKGDYMYFDCNTEEELAERYVDNVYGNLENMDKETLAKYFDFEAFGRDLSCDFDETIQGNYMSAD